MNTGLMVFNPQSLGVVDPDRLRMMLLNVHFETLCRQYGLNPSLINSARMSLKVVVSKAYDFPYFLVEYGDERGQPLVIFEWGLESPRGKCVLNHLNEGKVSEVIIARISAANFLVEIELSQHQLTNMGLLLAYEIARWAGEKGGGILLGLDRNWYRLNQHLAFILLE